METRLFWHIQNTKRVPKPLSWYWHGSCLIDEPADEYGWTGYYWVYPVDCMGDIDMGTPLLVRARDLRRAQEGLEVDMFVPGLWGTVYETAYTSWLESLSSLPRKYVALYEGEVLPGYGFDEWELFRPIRLVEVLTVREFLRRFSVPAR